MKEPVIAYLTGLDWQAGVTAAVTYSFRSEVGEHPTFKQEHNTRV